MAVGWDEGHEHAAAWRAAHASGEKAEAGYRNEGYGHREAVGAAIAAGITSYVMARNAMVAGDESASPW